jgi:hypothetical protein
VRLIVPSALERSPSALDRACAGNTGIRGVRSIAGSMRMIAGVLDRSSHAIDRTNKDFFAHFHPLNRSFMAMTCNTIKH